MSISVFTVLGRVAYSVGGELRADWPPRLQAIAGALLIQLGRPVSRTQLAEWVWSDESRMPSDLAATMHTYVGRIRRSLLRADGTAKLVTGSGYCRIDADPDLVDYHVFRATARQARLALNRGEPKLAFDKASAAIGLWQPDEPLAGLTSTKVENWRHRVIADEWVPAQDTLLSALLGLGECQRALVLLDDLQRDHPGELAFIKRRLETLHGLGHVEAATQYHLAAYKALRERGEDVAAEELGRLHQGAIERPALTVREQPPPPGPLRHRLPPDVPTFVGREAYLSKLDSFTTVNGVRRPRLVVLEGQAGVGKTTLALHWAHRLARTEPIFYYDVHGMGPGPRHETAEIVNELLVALDYPAERLGTPMRREHKLADLLSARPMVIVLDNVQNSEHVRGLLPLLADCTVLLTSRQRLTGLRTQHHATAVPVRPLATHHGVSLLNRLVGRRAEDAPQIITTLAQLSGGLPIALQLIAHHVERHPNVPLVAIADDLHDATTVLDLGEDGDTPAASLRASFAMSYDTLSPAEQHLFATLALNPGREISLLAAVALVGQPAATVRRGLEVLVGAHMIESADSIRRYRLHDLFRSFGQEMLASSPNAAHDRARLRLLSWYLHTSFRACGTLVPNRLVPPLLPIEPGVSPLDFATKQQANAWLVDERQNLLDVIAWSRTRYPSYAVRLPSVLYRTLRQYGHYADARQALEIAVDAAHILGDLELEGGSRHDLGRILLAMNEPAAANVEFMRAEGLARLAGSEAGITTSTYSLAGMAILAGKFDEGVRLYHEALERAKTANLLEHQSAILLFLGLAYRGRGARTKAFPCFQQAFSLASSLNDSHLLVKTLVPLAEISAELGDQAAAVAYGTQALELVETNQDLEEAPVAFVAMARINAMSGHYEPAAEYAEQAVRFAQLRREVQVEADALDVLATGLAALGHPEAAGERWRQAMEIHVDQGNHEQVKRIAGKLEKLSQSSAAIPTARARSTDDSALGKGRPRADQ